MQPTQVSSQTHQIFHLKETLLAIRGLISGTESDHEMAERIAACVGALACQIQPMSSPGALDLPVLPETSVGYTFPLATPQMHLGQLAVWFPSNQPLEGTTHAELLILAEHLAFALALRELSRPPIETFFHALLSAKPGHEAGLREQAYALAGTHLEAPHVCIRGEVVVDAESTLTQKRLQHIETVTKAFEHQMGRRFPHGLWYSPAPGQVVALLELNPGEDSLKAQLREMVNQIQADTPGSLRIGVGEPTRSSLSLTERYQRSSQEAEEALNCIRPSSEQARLLALSEPVLTFPESVTYYYLLPYLSRPPDEYQALLTRMEQQHPLLLSTLEAYFHPEVAGKIEKMAAHLKLSRRAIETRMQQLRTFCEEEGFPFQPPHEGLISLALQTYLLRRRARLSDAS